MTVVAFSSQINHKKKRKIENEQKIPEVEVTVVLREPVSDSTLSITGGSTGPTNELSRGSVIGVRKEQKRSNKEQNNEK